MKNIRKIAAIALQVTVAVWMWLGWKAYYKNYSFNEEEKTLRFHVYFKARWYSPVWWVNIIVKLFIFLFSGGINNWIMDCIADLTNDGDLCRGFNGTFTKKLNRFQLKWNIFIVTYAF